MEKMIKKILKTYVPQVVLNQLKKLRSKKQYQEWKKNGCPSPPPHIVKQMTIAEYQRKYGYTILIETGTYMGDMVEAQKSNFKKIFSIELGIDLFEKAQKRFKNEKNIAIVQGDSGKVLPQILKNLYEPAIFWLDGHYSAGITAKGDKNSPIFEELNAILNNKQFKHIITTVHLKEVE